MVDIITINYFEMAILYLPLTIYYDLLRFVKHKPLVME